MMSAVVTIYGVTLGYSVLGAALRPFRNTSLLPEGFFRPITARASMIFHHA